MCHASTASGGDDFFHFLFQTTKYRRTDSEVEDMDEKNEKDIVKQALQAPLVLKEHWLPIATGWFEKWKAYVNFADNEEVS